VQTQGRLHLTQACDVVFQIASALVEADKQHLVHRDIKPSNIMVTPEDQAKLLDFGLSRQVDTRMTQPGTLLGTIDYMAPEQARDASSVDIRADIYGLGATFYYLLTARTPFGEGTTAQKLIWYQTRRPRPISEIRGDVPEGMLAVIDKMMAKDAAQRYQTPAEVAEVQPGSPGPEYVWVRGYHRWDGHAYIWVHGRYERRQHVRANWVPAHWENRGRSPVWYAGHWG